MGSELRVNDGRVPHCEFARDAIGQDDQDDPRSSKLGFEDTITYSEYKAMEKAFTGKANEYIQVTMYRDDNEDYILRIRNSAPYFNPFLMKTGRLQQDVKEEFLESMGVMLVKKQAKSIFFRNYEGFNVILVIL